MLRVLARAARHTAAAALALVVATPGVRAGDAVIVPDWTAIEPEFFPLEPAAAIQPVLTAADCSGLPAFFVADPFLMRTDDLWYMFFEVTVPRGRIALATSLDGLDWKFQRLVLVEPFDLSFPHVLQVDGEYYMIPESAARQSVRLYHTANFPDGWTYVTDLVSGRPFADPCVFQRDGLWWMWVGNGASDTCWLYYSRFLDAEWTEHPQSPIVAGNRSLARPAGPAVMLADNRLYRLAQNSTPTYGRAVRVFEVDALTTTTYAEHEIAASPVLEASASGWNADGMHQLDPWWTGDSWLVATDGIQNGTWSIGIYRTAPVPTDAARLGGLGSLGVRSSPNPARASSTIRWDPGARGSAPRLSVYTPNGRRILTRVLPPAATTFVWDRTDARGDAVPAGVYFCTLEIGAHSETTRVVVVR